MEEDSEYFKPEPTTLVPAVTQVRNVPRQFQCRWAYGDSSACDAFHLGQIIRFFAVRTKTIFLGSTLIDPDFDLDPDSDQGYDSYSEEQEAYNGKEKEGATNNSNVDDGPSISDICSLIASLRQCPDYQLDSSHNGCGVRRRLLPALDCIEGFVGDGRSLLGVILRLWNGNDFTSSETTRAGPASLPPSTSPSWAALHSPFRRAHSVDVRLSKISSIHFLPGRSAARQPSSMSSTVTSSRPSKCAEEDARLFFTARRRNWEA